MCRPATTLSARIVAVLAVFCGVLAGAVSPAVATVRFGSNVLIGGHDFSNQTYGKGRRAVIHLYDRTPRNGGCAWHRDRGGGRVKICHLRRIGPR